MIQDLCNGISVISYIVVFLFSKLSDFFLKPFRLGIKEFRKSHILPSSVEVTGQSSEFQVNFHFKAVAPKVDASCQAKTGFQVEGSQK